MFNTRIKTFNTQITSPKRRGWIWLAALGVVAMVIGITLGFRQVSICGGSAFSGNGRIGYSDYCDRAIASAAVPASIFLILGIVLILTGVIVRSIGNNRPTVVTAAPARSIAAKIEDLSRLKNQGLISDAEFEAKRTELLGRL